MFLAMLQQARNSLTKPNNILIIDEIFDYLDDANLIAAQYYLTEFINEIKTKKYNIFPIILSHLNPYYFKSYAFKDMKVYYLNPHKPMYSSKMEKLLAIRADLGCGSKIGWTLVIKEHSSNCTEGTVYCSILSCPKPSADGRHRPVPVWQGRPGGRAAEGETGDHGQPGGGQAQPLLDPRPVGGKPCIVPQREGVP